MREILRNNGLSLAVFSLFLSFLIGESIAGFHAHNDDLREHGRAPLAYRDFLLSGAFIESTAENWESEFLEMGAYALLTAFLFQKGSSESREIDAGSPTRLPKRSLSATAAPWPVRRGGWILKVYENSLVLAFALLFLGSFALHAWGGVKAYNEDQRLHGGAQISLGQFIGTSQFWYQSLQNWQSEFLGLGSMIVLTIFLRQKGSPESKPIDAPDAQTGTE